MCLKSTCSSTIIWRTKCYVKYLMTKMNELMRSKLLMRLKKNFRRLIFLNNLKSSSPLLDVKNLCFLTTLTSYSRFTSWVWEEVLKSATSAAKNFPTFEGTTSQCLHDITVRQILRRSSLKKPLEEALKRIFYGCYCLINILAFWLLLFLKRD